MNAVLPAPPSANALFLVRNGQRYKTSKYRKWLCEADLMYHRQQRRRYVEPMPAKTPLRVRIEVAVDRRRDLDNCIKPLLDSLQKAGVIVDDRWVDSIQADRVPPGDVPAGWCKVSVEVK